MTRFTIQRQKFHYYNSTLQNGFHGCSNGFNGCSQSEHKVNDKEHFLTSYYKNHDDEEYYSFIYVSKNIEHDRNDNHDIQVVYAFDEKIEYCCFIGLFIHALIKFRARRKRNRKLLYERVKELNMFPNVLANVISLYT